MWIQGHKRLWKLGIYHRDISNGNMMYYRNGNHLFGVLIDFDLASLERVFSQNRHRTGTRPFMATRLLAGEPPGRHLYKYDAESFFWVAVYDSALEDHVSEWGNFDNSALAKEKSYYLMWGTKTIPMADRSDKSRPIRHWLIRTCEHFFFDSKESKDWGVDELYNVLRGYRDDRGTGLPAHIKTRQANYTAGGTQ